MNKQSYQIIPLRDDFLEKVRCTGLDDQNQPVEVSFAKGGEPCRDVMRAAKPGEKIILASYCPFTLTGPYKEYGPVFVLAEKSEQLACESILPLLGNPEVIIAESDYCKYLGNTFVFKAYSERERILEAHLASPATALSIVDNFFANSEVAFVLARYAAFGCYSFRASLKTSDDSGLKAMNRERR